MNTRHRFLLVPTIVVASSLMGVSASYAAVKPTEEAAPKLPEIWQKAGPRERLKATRAAEIDADRLLVERLYGLQIDSNTTVFDLTAGDDKVAGAFSASLVGSLTIGEPEYLADGRVQVVRAVKIQEVVETLNRVIKGKRLADGLFANSSENEKTDRSVTDKVIDVMGTAALPGSEGHQKIMAKRAAEMDAYRRLAARMMQQKINSDTTVRDMCLQNDQIVAKLSQVLKAATPTNIKYFDDGSCEVTMEIKVSDLIRTTRSYMKGDTQKTEIKDDINERSFSEIGRGTMHPVAAIMPAALPQGDAPALKNSPNDPFFETEMILKQVIQSGPVVQ